MFGFTSDDKFEETQNFLNNRISELEGKVNGYNAEKEKLLKTIDELSEAVTKLKNDNSRELIVKSIDEYITKSEANLRVYLEKITTQANSVKNVVQELDDKIAALDARIPKKRGRKKKEIEDIETPE